MRAKEKKNESEMVSDRGEILRERDGERACGKMSEREREMGDRRKSLKTESVFRSRSRQPKPTG